MAREQSGSRSFRAAAMGRPGGGHSITVPFDPGASWGARDRFHVHGTVGGWRFRGSLTPLEGAWVLDLGPAWCRTPGFDPGDEVAVVMELEGPHSTTMGSDIAAAFATEPEAARFFDSLPSFYRNAHARWIEDAKRPETRAKRIAAVVDLSSRGQRER